MPEEAAGDLVDLMEHLAAGGQGDEPLKEVLLLRLLLACQRSIEVASASPAADRPHAQRILELAEAYIRDHLAEP